MMTDTDREGSPTAAAGSATAGHAPSELVAAAGDVELGSLTSPDLSRLLAAYSVVALVPVGSGEPHGPHLPLATDTLISQAVAQVAAKRLSTDGRRALLCPPLPYGVTDFAAGFAGAISVPREVLTAMLAAIARGYLASGFAHVCFINNHLEPEQDQALRDVPAMLPAGSVSIACPLSRRWGRTLSDEYKSGCCHAGQYETSLILAAHPNLVKRAAARALPALNVSLSDGIRAGQNTFRQMGLDQAYTGAPAAATAEEGVEMIERLATMVVTEVTEALAESHNS